MSFKSNDGVLFAYEGDSQRGWQTDFVERFGYYGTGGLYDPKNYTIEPWILGGGTVGYKPSHWSRPTWAGFGKGFLLSQTIAFVGIGLVGAILDPLDKNKGGLDEYIGSVYDDYGVFHNLKELADHLAGPHINVFDD